DDHLEPTTLPVDTRPSGRSWCGIHHMSGNVAEWTSSWFAPYPDSRIEPHPYMGSWVKVIRGGSAVDLETLALRPAARNFVGAGPDAPPYPENLFQFVGFRLASYRQPGRDHVAPVVRRATSGHLKPGALDRERFAAFVQRDWHPADAEVPNHVYVRGRATAVVFVPVTHILRPTGGPRMMAAWKNASALRKASGLRKKARDESPFFVLGALHLDLPLEGVDVPTGVAVKKTRGSAKAPATEPGRCAPGTYLVTLWFDRIALTTATREFVCFLPALASKIPSVEVRPRSSESLGSPTLRPSLERDEGGLDFTVLLGGRRSKDKYVVRVRAALPYAKDAFLGALARDGWLKSTDGR
ncbi:MAG: SUMF1/EgtB/PvdO family nonheme iron enzyme, partial [Planctomycetota bacterium]|nr:SUMF1/EgtB/PvdO family nonheme iron enzyme [Planctomycetota bacterium]